MFRGETIRPGTTNYRHGRGQRQVRVVCWPGERTNSDRITIGALVRSVARCRRASPLDRFHVSREWTVCRLARAGACDDDVPCHAMLALDKSLAECSAMALWFLGRGWGMNGRGVCHGNVADDGVQGGISLSVFLNLS